MSGLRDAFKQLLKIHGRTMELTRGALDGNSVEIAFDVRVTPSNYSRILAGPSETVIEGREFVMDKDELAKITPRWVLKRGDTLRDDDLGELTIIEIIEMYELGGAICGYRIRTN